MMTPQTQPNFFFYFSIMWIFFVTSTLSMFLQVKEDGHSLHQSLESYFYRVISPLLGVVLFSNASLISKSLLLRYCIAVVFGIILSVLLTPIKAMKILNSGRKSHLSTFIFPAMAALGYIFLRYERGTLLVITVVPKAWTCFWMALDLLLTEDDVINMRISYFISWWTRVLALFMILPAALDPPFTAEPLMAGMLVVSVLILWRIFRSRFVYKVYWILLKLVKNIAVALLTDDWGWSIFGDSDKEVSGFVWPETRRFSTWAFYSCTRSIRHNVYPSTFYSTGRFSKEDRKDEFIVDSREEVVNENPRDKFIADSREKVVNECLTSTWVVTPVNGGGIVTPKSTVHSLQRYQEKEDFMDKLIRRSEEVKAHKDRLIKRPIRPGRKKNLEAWMDNLQWHPIWPYPKEEVEPCKEKSIKHPIQPYLQEKVERTKDKAIMHSIQPSLQKNVELRKDKRIKPAFRMSLRIDRNNLTRQRSSDQKRKQISCFEDEASTRKLQKREHVLLSLSEEQQDVDKALPSPTNIATTDHASKLPSSSVIESKTEYSPPSPECETERACKRRALGKRQG